MTRDSSVAVKSIVVPFKGAADPMFIVELAETIDKLWGRERVLVRSDLE